MVVVVAVAVVVVVAAAAAAANDVAKTRGTFEEETLGVYWAVTRWKVTMTVFQSWLHLGLSASSSSVAKILFVPDYSTVDVVGYDAGDNYHQGLLRTLLESELEHHYHQYLNLFYFVVLPNWSSSPSYCFAFAPWTQEVQKLYLNVEQDEQEPLKESAPLVLLQ